MSKKYVIELDDRIKLVTSVGVTENGVVYTTSDYVHNLEELNSDYINEHYGELQDEAYRRGYEDGKNIIDNGCEGCKYTVRFEDDEPCKSCSNCYKNKYEPTPQEDDRIEVGDEVEAAFGTAVVVCCDYDENKASYIYSSGKHGFDNTWNLTKTGKHYDIASILEAMRTHD